MLSPPREVQPQVTVEQQGPGPRELHTRPCASEHTSAFFHKVLPTHSEHKQTKGHAQDTYAGQEAWMLNWKEWTLGTHGRCSQWACEHFAALPGELRGGGEGAAPVAKHQPASGPEEAHPWVLEPPGPCALHRPALN